MVNDKILGNIGYGIGGVALGSALGFGASKLRKGHSKRRKYRRVVRSSTHKRHRIKHRTSAKGKLRYHKTKHRGGKAIHYTKHGQPYRIMANGRARFIKKR